MGKELLKAIAVCAELTGTELSPAAAEVFAADLGKYSENQVMGALSRCRRELKGRLTLADVISRLDDGRPGVEEAWAMVPKSEMDSVIWTEEMALAMGVASGLIENGDLVGARMAFKEKYLQLCQQARDQGIMVSWRPSYGMLMGDKERFLIAGFKDGKLTEAQMRIHLPHFDELGLLGNIPQDVKQLADKMTT